MLLLELCMWVCVKRPSMQSKASFQGLGFMALGFRV